MKSQGKPSRFIVSRNYRAFCDGINETMLNLIALGA